MNNSNEISLDYCRKQLSRALWRFQYRIRKKENFEFTDILKDCESNTNLEEEIASKLNVIYILNNIPSIKARYIIIRTVLQGVTEKKVGSELKISQQAVHKCKLKTLMFLREKMNNLK
ncbi:MAG: hypothetical protein Q8942_03145 [Bacillota bacterium]|nr:hypothetical protein [Bacillota bacterium]